ncbi:MAG: hypothetical protein IT267_00280 [Saprospiraceae bacterium]|nr:hypothetical protein [Saprospiraceae bacterium]
MNSQVSIANKRSSLICVLLNKINIELFNRLCLAIVFFWFGFLKILKISPAEDLIHKLHAETISTFISFENFYVLLGYAECIIGLLWIIKKYTNTAFILFILHMTTTFLPFIFLHEEISSGGLKLNLTGQYIVKNLVLIACAINILLLNYQKENSQNV